MAESLRILVVGAGGIGGQFAGRLGEKGHQLTLLCGRASTAERLKQNGLTLVDDEGRRVIRLPKIFDDLSAIDGEFDAVIITVQPTELDALAPQLLPKLASTGHLVLIQNGLCEERLVQLFEKSGVKSPAGRPWNEVICGAVVTWSGSVDSQGAVYRTGAGKIILGNLAGTENAQLLKLAETIGKVSPVELSSNLRGARWSKLAFNCVVSTLGTVSGLTLGELLKSPAARRVALKLLRESYLTGKAGGVRFERIIGPVSIEFLGGSQDIFSNRLRHLWLKMVGARYRDMRSSMLFAIENGRTPAVEFLNGEIISSAEALGVKTPNHIALKKLVWEIAEGKRGSDLSLLEALDRSL